MTNFANRKAQQLIKIDRSNEQKWDAKIKSLCEKINKKENYYTTSSCSGRVIIVKGPSKSLDAFILKSHSSITFKQLKDALNKTNFDDLLYFKQEPMIIHIACKTLQDAVDLLDLSQNAGFKKKGIISTRDRFIVEILGSEKLELPIKDKKVLVSDEYLKLLVKESNIRLKRNWEKIRKLEKLIA